MTSKVYIVNANGHSFDAAKEYGELETVTTGMQPIFKQEVLEQRIKLALDGFETQDFLLLNGPNILNILCTTYLLRKFSSIQVLLHNAINNSYVARIIER